MRTFPFGGIIFCKLKYANIVLRVLNSANIPIHVYIAGHKPVLILQIKTARNPCAEMAIEQTNLQLFHAD